MTRLAWLGRYLWSGWAGAAGLCCLLAAWQAGHEAYGSFILPSPVETLAAMGDIVRAPAFAPAAGDTAARALLGFALAAGLGTLAGTLAGFSFAAMRLLKPVVAVILGVPPISWIVLALIWFGATGGSAVATVVVAALPISFAGALEGITTRDRSLDAMARVFGAGPIRRFRTVTLPRLLSYLFPAWTTTVGTAWKVTVMAELLANAGGIGGEIATARALFDIAQVTAWTALVVVFALATDYGLLHPLREAVEHWRSAGLPWGVKRVRLAFERVGHAFLGRTVLEEVDLVLGAGEIVALVGPSGSGKTTLLQIAVGLVDPLRGSIRRRYRRHAMVFQEPRLLPWLTARDNIAYGLAALGVPRRARREAASARAGEVGLDPADIDKYPAELSGGMRQRVSVARALAVAPEVMFFDEPFTAVDVGLKRILQDLVVRFARASGFSGLFVTHDLAEAVRVADRLAILSARRHRIVDIRTIPGRPGERDDRSVFGIVAGWSQEAAFAELFDGEDRRAR